jgi:hypothetical protein
MIAITNSFYQIGSSGHPHTTHGNIAPNTVAANTAVTIGAANPPGLSCPFAFRSVPAISEFREPVYQIVRHLIGGSKPSLAPQESVMMSAVWCPHSS